MSGEQNRTSEGRAEEREGYKEEERSRRKWIETRIRMEGRERDGGESEREKEGVRERKKGREREIL